MKKATHCAILCGFYSRVAFIKLSVIGKIARNCKGFEKSQFYFKKTSNFSGQRAFVHLSCIGIAIRDTGFVHVRMCYSNISCG